MYGWRARIGYVGPRLLDVPPHEFWAHAPSGVVMIAAGAGHPRVGGSGWVFDEGSLQRSVGELQKFQPDAVVVNWADVGLGTAVDARALAGDDSAAPVLSDLAVLVDVLARRDVDRVSVASPWDDAHARAVAAILGDAGHTVVGMATAACPHLCAAGAMDVDAVTGVARRAVGGSRSSAVVLASAHWRTLAAQDDIATALDVPVMSLNGALLWHAQDLLRPPARSWENRRPDPALREV